MHQLSKLVTVVRLGGHQNTGCLIFACGLRLSDFRWWFDGLCSVISQSFLIVFSRLWWCIMSGLKILWPLFLLQTFLCSQSAAINSTVVAIKFCDGFDPTTVSVKVTPLDPYLPFRYASFVVNNINKTAYVDPPWKYPQNGVKSIEVEAYEDSICLSAVVVDLTVVIDQETEFNKTCEEKSLKDEVLRPCKKQGDAISPVTVCANRISNLLKIEGAISAIPLSNSDVTRPNELPKYNIIGDMAAASLSMAEGLADTARKGVKKRIRYAKMIGKATDILESVNSFLSLAGPVFNVFGGLASILTTFLTPNPFEQIFSYLQEEFSALHRRLDEMEEKLTTKIRNEHAKTRMAVTMRHIRFSLREYNDMLETLSQQPVCNEETLISLPEVKRFLKGYEEGRVRQHLEDLLEVEEGGLPLTESLLGPFMADYCRTKPDTVKGFARSMSSYAFGGVQAQMAYTSLTSLTNKASMASIENNNNLLRTILAGVEALKEERSPSKRRIEHKQTLKGKGGKGRPSKRRMEHKQLTKAQTAHKSLDAPPQSSQSINESSNCDKTKDEWLRKLYKLLVKTNAIEIFFDEPGKAFLQYFNKTFTRVLESDLSRVDKLKQVNDMFYSILHDPEDWPKKCILDMSDNAVVGVLADVSSQDSNLPIDFFGPNSVVKPDTTLLRLFYKLPQQWKDFYSRLPGLWESCENASNFEVCTKNPFWLYGGFPNYRDLEVIYQEKFIEHGDFKSQERWARPLLKSPPGDPDKVFYMAVNPDNRYVGVKVVNVSVYVEDRGVATPRFGCFEGSMRDMNYSIERMKNYSKYRSDVEKINKWAAKMPEICVPSLVCPSSNPDEDDVHRFFVIFPPSGGTDFNYIQNLARKRREVKKRNLQQKAKHSNGISIPYFDPKYNWHLPP